MTTRALHGRVAELDAMSRGLDAARAGRTAAFALIGEPGIGKTRLTHAIAERAGEHGFVTCWGRAWEAGGAPAYWPWRMLFESLPQRPTDPALAQLWGKRHAAADPDQARFELFEAVASALRETSAAAPLLCVLDDLHAADLPSLELAAFATKHVRGARIAWVATWRDAEAAREPIRDPIARIAREATLLPLGGLTRREIGELIDEVRGDASPALRAALAGATGGNPLFLLETLASGAGTGIVGGARLPVAHGIATVVRERLALLPSDARAVLDAAAAVGRDVALDRWAIAAGATAEAVRAAARAIAASGMLDEAGPDRWRFRHDLVREAIERAAPDGRIAAAHGRIARALDRDSESGERAFHALHGDVEPPVALAWSIAAADHARAQCAYEEAIAVLDRAVAGLGAVAERDPGLLLALGRARCDLGDVRAARDTLSTAIKLARAAGDPATVARAVLAYGSRTVLGDILDELIDMIDGALAELPADAADLHARLLARKAAALAPPERPDECLGMARDALQLAAASPDIVTRLEVAVAVGSAVVGFAHPREHLPVDREMVELARAVGDRALELRGLGRAITTHYALGDFARADALVAERDALARALRLPRFAWHGPLFRSMRAMTVGDDAACDAAMAEAEAIAATAGDANAPRTLAAHRAWADLVLDRTDALVRQEPALMAALRTMGPILSQILRAVIRLRTGDHAAARAEVDAIDPALPQSAILSLATLAEVVAAVGPTSMQREVYARLLPFADTFPVWSLFALDCYTPVAASLALLARALGDPDAAARHHDDALARARAVNATGLVAAIERRWGASRPAPAAPAPAAVQLQFAIRAHAGAWQVEHAGATALVPDLRGMPMLERLVARPDVEIHALELVSGTAERTADAGDAGEVIDAKAREAYRKRAAALADKVEDAEARGDIARAEAARDELETLQRELSRAIGKGGRTRRAGVAAERARITAQRRIREAIKKIVEVDAALGAHLDAAIRTGTFCVYRVPRT